MAKRIPRSRGDEVKDVSSLNELAEAAYTSSVSMGSEPSEEEIRMRAYRRYLERGGADGLDFEDWMEAERDLKTSR